MFTLAIPTFNDFNSLSCCLVANLQQPHVRGAVVADNAPDSHQGKLTREFCASLKGRGVRYVPCPEAVGTAAAKNRAVAECPDGAVIGLDSHVLLMPGATSSLAEFMLSPAVSADLIHGPMMHDNLTGFHTHLTTRWTPELAALERAHLAKDVQKGAARAATVRTGGQLWSEGMWGRWGTDRRAAAGVQAFEIEAMGMGAFACHRETWLGFHPDMRGFGGEEGYIHEKYRRAGRRVWCVSGFRWWHRFGKGDGTPHAVLGKDKYRNYLLGFREVGLPTDEVTAHFRGWLSDEEATQIETGGYDPTKPAPAPGKPGCASCGTRHKHLADLPTLFDAVVAAGSKPTDINEHVDTLWRFASAADGVLDVGSRVESALALAGTKGAYHHLGTLPLGEREMVHKYRNEAVTAPAADAMPEYDLVFIDTDPHEAVEVLSQLETFGTRSRHRIVLHDTVVYGEQGSRGGPGVLYAVRRFIKLHPEWTAVRHDRNNNGLLVLSRDPKDKKKLPGIVTSGVNVLKAMARAGANVLAKDGPLKDTPTQDGRLALCMVCDSLNNGRCAECACPVEKKTGWPTEFCPLGLWDSVEAPQ